MKPNVYTSLGALTIAAFMAACGGGGGTKDLTKKQDELKKKKAQQVELTKEIKDLEAEIAKLSPDSSKVKAKDIEVKELAPRAFEHYVKTQGQIEAEDNILVSAKSAGVVTQVFVKEGQQVSKGQVLAQIENSVIQRNIEAQRSELDLAVTMYERQKNLWDQKIGTEVQYLQAKTKKEGLERQIASLQEQLDMSRIKAPISGTVDEVTVKVGENIAPGMPAVRVVNASDLKVKANVSEAYVTAIKKNNKVRVVLPDLNNREIEATVTFVGKNIDPLSRTFPVEVKLKPQADLRPNMTAVIKVIYHTEASTLVIPANIVQSINDEKVVYIAEAAGKDTVARRKVVKVAGVFDNLAQVEGLKPGDKVITTGYQGLNDGEPVKL
ncbi:efflux RND transporter periplasmic adaptor subunit [Dawidia soli]|uniref:Efflux RND transporter periplasmic adaptor subunit n=1 Tax=Dawidia soli TaxID=2782352 RepID=A0AAP2DBM6_9BACT|nr:efflux RND transporter periplasmic adaptor subunit [Dawidia soli]MBT1687940.1 efflux RND transporter periplasmic adaptor subunit [Dawidia soli]